MYPVTPAEFVSAVFLPAETTLALGSDEEPSKILLRNSDTAEKLESSQDSNHTIA